MRPMPTEALGPVAEHVIGAPVVILRSDDDGARSSIYELLAQACRVVVFDVGGEATSVERLRDAARDAAGAPYALVASRSTSDLALALATAHGSDVAVLALLSPSTNADAVAGLDMPVMVVLGTDDDVIPTAIGRTFVEANAEVYLMFVYKAGHFVEHNRPVAVANLLSRFVLQGREWLVNRADTRLAP
jgi:pimeloyl-ACP methyl ester carboxylesterase